MSTTTKKIKFASGTKLENYGAIKKAKPITRNLKKRKAINDEKWYLNGVGQIHGPYNGSALRHWLETNQIGPSTEIRMGEKGEFSDLIEHFPVIEDAFCVPSELSLYLLARDGAENVSMTCIHTVSRHIEINQNIERVIAIYNSSSDNVKTETEIWMGEYYLGKMRDVGVQMIVWNLNLLTEE